MPPSLSLVLHGRIGSWLVSATELLSAAQCHHIVTVARPRLQPSTS